MKSKIEEGLATSLGLNIAMRKVDGRRAYGIIGVAYDLWEATVAATLPPFIVITPRPGVGNPSVTGIADLVLSVRRAFGRYSAYGCLALSAVERMRLVSRQVPFLVAGRQVYLPFLGIALRGDSVAVSRSWLGAAAQGIIYAWLSGRLGDGFRERDIIRELGCSRASAFRAMSELSAFGLIMRSPNGCSFVPGALESFRLFQPRLRASPWRNGLIQAAFGQEDKSRLLPTDRSDA